MCSHLLFFFVIVVMLIFVFSFIILSISFILSYLSKIVLRPVLITLVLTCRLLRALCVRPGPESSNKHLVLIVFSFLSSLVSYWLS